MQLAQRRAQMFANRARIGSGLIDVRVEVVEQVDVEGDELAAVVERNCACEYDADGWRKVTCAPHRMLTHDQRALNGLRFVRQIAERLRLEEFSVSALSS